MRQVSLLLLALAVLSGAAAGQVVDAVAGPLREHQYDLATKGSTFLEEEAAKAAFFMIGELHGDNEIPALIRAIWPAMWKAGYRHIAAELSPWAANRLEFDPNAPQRSFSWTRSDVSFVAAHRQGANAVLWGCDMEEARPHLLLQELAAANPRNQELQSAAELTKDGYRRATAPKLLEHVRKAGEIKDLLAGGVSLRSSIIRTLEIEVDRRQGIQRGGGCRRRKDQLRGSPHGLRRADRRSSVRVPRVNRPACRNGLRPETDSPGAAPDS
jgi:hypothetical protein